MTKNLFFVDNKEFVASSQTFTTLEIKSLLRNYQLCIIDEPLTHSRVLEYTENNDNILFADSNVNELHHISKKATRTNRIIIRDASESLKTIEGAVDIINLFDEKNLTKNENIIVCGGGIIQDVAAFAASVYKRGIPWIFFPTTLLSMSDSCLGGKASLNFKNAKNQIGLFSTPNQIIINPHFIRTLSKQDISSGLGEILKMCIIGGESYLDFYKENIKNIFSSHPKEFIPLICNSLNIKQSVIEADEYEINHRKVLNYGHTVGHAIEILSEYKIPHGLAVVAGMIVANELSEKMNLLSKSEKKSINNICYELLGEKTLKIIRDLNLTSLIEVIKKDKKANSTSISFVLIKTKGKSVFQEVDLNDYNKKIITDIISNCFL